ncbi:MAG: hypothetical protein LBC02_01730, partial [Planctomycetaceae bacterium]|nr:hypothetical protein [Planctomycetaceae bacterium]
MENIISSIFTVLGGALFLFVVVYFSLLVGGCITVYWLTFAWCKKLKKQTLPIKQYRLFRQVDHWATENDFHYVGIFWGPGCLLAGWENPKTSSFLTQYLNFNGLYLEFDTVFDNNIILETGNLRLGTISLPTPPSFYVQNFPKKSHEELWKLHNESIRYLMEQGNVHLTPFQQDLPWGNIPSIDPFAEQKPLAMEVFQNSGFRTIGKYIRSHFLLFLYIPFGSFYRPFFWVHKTIQEQVEMGRLVLPQELPPDYEKYFVRWSPKKQLSDFEPLERSKLFSETEYNANATKIDAATLYSREYAVEPKTVGWIGKSAGWLITLLLVVFCGIMPLYWG